MIDSPHQKRSIPQKKTPALRHVHASCSSLRDSINHHTLHTHSHYTHTHTNTHRVCRPYTHTSTPCCVSTPPCYDLLPPLRCTTLLCWLMLLSLNRMFLRREGDTLVGASYQPTVKAGGLAGEAAAPAPKGNTPPPPAAGPLASSPPPPAAAAAPVLPVATVVVGGAAPAKMLAADDTHDGT